jgi:hypothetical protein
VPGYSGTPLVRKLGIKDGMRGRVYGAPREYGDIVADLPADLRFSGDDEEQLDFVHFFTSHREGLRDQLEAFRCAIRPEGAIWVSWPKRAARVKTDLTEDVVRQEALSAGLVDVKVCAVDDTWSALKLVIRLADRP